MWNPWVSGIWCVFHRGLRPPPRVWKVVPCYKVKVLKVETTNVSGDTEVWHDLWYSFWPSCRTVKVRQMVVLKKGVGKGWIHGFVEKTLFWREHGPQIACLPNWSIEKRSFCFWRMKTKHHKLISVVWLPRKSRGACTKSRGASRFASPQKFRSAGIMIILVLLELLPTAHRYDPHDSVVTTSFLAWDFWELYPGSR